MRVHAQGQWILHALGYRCINTIPSTMNKAITSFDLVRRVWVALRDSPEETRELLSDIRGVALESNPAASCCFQLFMERYMSLD